MANPTNAPFEANSTNAPFVANQKFYDDLITTDDNHPSLLQQKEIEMQPVINNDNAAAPKGTSFEQYILVCFLIFKNFNYIYCKN